MLCTNDDELILNGCTPILQQKRRDILEMLSAALDAVMPSRVVSDICHDSLLVFPSETIDLTSFDHLFLVGFGKASVGMAQAVCEAASVTKGVVITNNPRARVTNDVVKVMVGGHPLPNNESIHGADQIISLIQGCSENDCVIVLISGGGSSLFCKPWVPLESYQQTIDLLVRSGAPIDEVNTVRKHLSLVKGGQLAKQTKATMVSLIISDVIHDQISSIASGPTSPDSTTYMDAEDILHRHQLWEKIPEEVIAVLEKGRKGELPETLKEGDAAFEKVFNYVIANNEQACDAAVRKGVELGYDTKLITTSLSGEARTLGPYLIERIKNSLIKGNGAFVTGGEPTVTVRGNGHGGRNQEFVLGCIEDIADSEMVLASFATDGIDGKSTVAGALADGCSLARAQKKHLLPAHFLRNNDSFAFFQALGDTLQTGVTGTNVMDIQIILR